MDKNKEFIINYQIKQNKSVLELLEKIGQLIISNISFFAGMLKSEKNFTDEMPKILTYTQGEIIDMKYQNKTIHRNLKCKTWYTRYRENGKQYYVSGKTQQEVLNKLKTRLKINKKQNTKETTLQKWFEQWLSLFKINKVKDITIKNYYKSIKHIDESVLNCNIDKITPINIINTLQNISHERTRQQTYELLSALFEKAKDYDIVNKNIMNLIEKPKHIKEKGIALTTTEQNKLIQFCKNYIYGDIILTTLFEGLRIGEVLAITGNDIDITNKKLTINKSFNSSGKIDTTKNPQSNRTIPIFDNCIEILKKYIHKKEKRIFEISYNVPQKHLKKIIQQINIRDISPHDLRHTFITNCKNQNIPEHIVQSWVGHNIGSKITSTIYTHVNEEDTLLYLDKYNKSL